MKSEQKYVIDVVIPAHAIGPVLADTVLSVFAQGQHHFDLRCMVVVDGCPLIETTAGILDDLGGSGCFDLEVIYKKAGGVVSARNVAIEHILQKSIRADFVLFLDGDDILTQNYIKESIDAINETSAPEDKEIGWAYTDQFNFGNVTRWIQYPTIMWSARFSQNNFSQMSSLISTKILEAGLRFDPQFNLGIEDWDFWCGAVRLGFLGAHVTDSYVLYRRLVGSRSSKNRSNDGFTRFILSQKHQLDSYEFATNDASIFPRYGAFVSNFALRALAQHLDIPKDVCFNNDPTEIAQFFNKLALRARYRGDGILDKPYVPEIIIVDAYGSNASVSDSLMFALEHLFMMNGDLSFVAVHTTYESKFLICAPDRLYMENGHRKKTQICSDIQVSGKCGLGEMSPTSRIKDTYLAASAAKFIESAPQIIKNNRGGIQKYVVGDQSSSIYTLYNKTLGYLPFFPRNFPVNSKQAAIVIPSDGFDIDLKLFRTHLEELSSQFDVHLVIAFAQTVNTNFLNAIFRIFGKKRVHYLHDKFLGLATSIKRNFNGVALTADNDNWVKYSAGLFSYFDQVVNFGILAITPALNLVKYSKCIKCIYVPNANNQWVSEIEYLCAYRDTYDSIHACKDWTISAAAMGVREQSLDILTIET